MSLGLGAALPLLALAPAEALDRPAGAREARPDPAPRPAVVAVTAEPGVAVLTPGRTAAFSATVSGTGNPAVTWAVDGVPCGNAALGIVNPGQDGTATYTAPAAPGRHTLTVASMADPSRSATSIIHVLASSGPAPVVPVSVAPAAASLRAGSALALSATVTGLANPAVTWMVDGVADGSAALGTLTQGPGNSVTYTAPATAGTHAVNAISVADPGKSGVSLITVVVNPPDSGSPARPGSESLP